MLGGLTITNAGGQGINMNGGTNLTLTTVNVNNAGNGADENGLKMVNVGGNMSIQGSTFNHAKEQLLDIDNTNTSLTLNVGTETPSFFNHGSNAVVDVSTGNGILMAGRGTTNFNVNIGNLASGANKTTFTNVKLFAVQVGGDGTWSGNNTNINIDNCQFTVDIPWVAGSEDNRANTINIQGRNTVDLDINVRNNTISAGGGGGIQIGMDESSHGDAVISGNNVSNQIADGILVAIDENASLTMQIDSNTISNLCSLRKPSVNADSTRRFPARFSGPEPRAEPS